MWFSVAQPCRTKWYNYKINIRLQPRGLKWNERESSIQYSDFQNYKKDAFFMRTLRLCNVSNLASAAYAMFHACWSTSWHKTWSRTFWCLWTGWQEQSFYSTHTSALRGREFMEEKQTESYYYRFVVIFLVNVLHDTWNCPCCLIFFPNFFTIFFSLFRISTVSDGGVFIAWCHYFGHLLHPLICLTGSGFITWLCILPVAVVTISAWLVSALSCGESSPVESFTAPHTCQSSNQNKQKTQTCLKHGQSWN